MPKEDLVASTNLGVLHFTVCPGMVRTPLWTGDEAKHVASQFAYTDDVCIEPEDVAEAMIEMVTQGEYAGGSLLAISKGNMRERLESTQSFEITSPEMQAWADNCYEPMREVFRKERGTK